MNKFCVALLWFGIILFAGKDMQAQNREIIFGTGDFAQMLAAAKTSDKLLFIDCHTSWCGPCKLLAKDVFTIDSVADFFNTNFINMKMDMEKGEGIELKKRYSVEAYPTLLLLNGEGKEIFRSVGGCTAPVLMSRFREGMNPENSISLLEKEFAEGKCESVLAEKYFSALKKGHHQELLAKATADYFREMKVKEICRDEHWNLYDTYVSNIDSPLYHLMIENCKEFKKLRGAAIMEEKWAAAYSLVIFNMLANAPLTEDQYRQYSDDVKKMKIQDEKALFYLNSYLELAHLRANRQYDKYLDIFESGPEGFEPERKLTLAMCLNFMADGTLQQRQRAMALLIREAQAAIERDGKLAPNLNQILGYIQFQLKEGTAKKKE